MAIVTIDLAVLVYENDKEFLQILDGGELIDISLLTSAQQSVLSTFYRLFGLDDHFALLTNVPITDDLYCIRAANFDHNHKLEIDLVKYAKVEGDYDLLVRNEQIVVDEFCLLIKTLKDA